MAIYKDDRTAEQLESHPIIILATDRFMSGWGDAANGASYAGWACRPDDAPVVRRWVEARSEMLRVREVGNDYRPGRHCAHCHIYVADKGHPALYYL